MPRRPRLYIPQQPQHIVVRGHNRDPIVTRPEDFRFLYRCLRDAAHKTHLAIHAWVFMNNHIHLLVTPVDEQALPSTMQSVGRRYVQYFNRCYHRSGALWEDRYKSCLVDSGQYLLACYRYIELNPVRAGIVEQPEDYPYSSYHANALGRLDNIITTHDEFLEFVTERSESKKTEPDTGIYRSVYQALCREGLDRKTLRDIRQGVEKGMGNGQASFLQKVAHLR